MARAVSHVTAAPAQPRPAPARPGPQAAGGRPRRPPAATRRKLASLAQALATEGGVRAAPVLRLKPGAMLVREWHGHSHTVLVLEDGFEHAGQRYASLSHIARVITGAHWSGPRFFGLGRAPRPSRTRPGKAEQVGGAPEHA